MCILSLVETVVNSISSESGQLWIRLSQLLLPLPVLVIYKLQLYKSITHWTVLTLIITDRNCRAWNFFCCRSCSDAVCDVCVCACVCGRSVRYCGNTTNLAKHLTFNHNAEYDEGYAAAVWRRREVLLGWDAFHSLSPLAVAALCRHRERGAADNLPLSLTVGFTVLDVPTYGASHSLQTILYIQINY